MTNKVYNISAQVLMYAMLATLLMAVGLSLLMGWLAWNAMSDATEARAALHQSQDTARTCRIALERMDAKMELVDRWVLTARGLRNGESAATGGDR